jgi:hypothetical protein
VALFPLYWLLAPLVSLKLAAASLAVYLAADAAMAGKILLDTRSASVAALSAAIFPAMHMAYGTGLWWGLVSKALRLKRVRQGTIDIMRVKQFCDVYPEAASSEDAKELIGGNTGSGGKVALEHKARPAKAALGV